VLREKRAATLPAESASPSTSESPTGAEESALLEERLDTFWQAGEALGTFAVKPGVPEIDKAILKRLGNAPFAIGNQNIAPLLSKAYSVVEAAAL